MAAVLKGLVEHADAFERGVHVLVRIVGVDVSAPVDAQKILHGGSSIPGPAIRRATVTGGACEAFSTPTLYSPTKW